MTDVRRSKKEENLPMHSQIIAVLVLMCSGSSFAATGILEVNSSPSGAKVYIDGTYVGTTPYQDVEVQLGEHRVKCILGSDHPPREKRVTIDPITPQVINFSFEERTGGEFTGTEVEEKVSKHKGNIQFASIPTGATIYIDGVKKAKAPVGYKDVNVGFYNIAFKSGGKELKKKVAVERGKTTKVIADFNSRQVRGDTAVDAKETKEAFLKRFHELWKNFTLCTKNNYYYGVWSIEDQLITTLKYMAENNRTASTFFCQSGDDPRSPCGRDAYRGTLPQIETVLQIDLVESRDSISITERMSRDCVSLQENMWQPDFKQDGPWTIDLGVHISDVKGW